MVKSQLEVQWAYTHSVTALHLCQVNITFLSRLLCVAAVPTVDGMQCIYSAPL